MVRWSPRRLVSPSYAGENECKLLRTRNEKIRFGPACGVARGKVVIESHRTWHSCLTMHAADERTEGDPTRVDAKPAVSLPVLGDSFGTLRGPSASSYWPSRHLEKTALHLSLVALKEEMEERAKEDPMDDLR